MSREIRDLVPAAQVRWNKLHDRCRRDLRLAKRGISIILTCTLRNPAEHENVGGKWDDPITGGKGFEFYILQHGRVVSDTATLEIVYEHTKDLDLAITGMEPVQCELISDGNS